MHHITGNSYTRIEYIGVFQNITLHPTGLIFFAICHICALVVNGELWFSFL